MVFLYLCLMEKEHLIFGIRAIIEAIQSGAAVDKVFITKRSFWRVNERFDESHETF